MLNEQLILTPFMLQLAPTIDSHIIPKATNYLTFMVSLPKNRCRKRSYRREIISLQPGGYGDWPYRSKESSVLHKIPD